MLSKPESFLASANIDAPTLTFLTERAQRIRDLGNRVIGDVVEIGRLLVECRDRLKEERNWRAWLEAGLGWSPQTAGRFIQLHELSLKRSNLEHLELPISGLYLLAAPSTPESARTEVIERAEAGERLKHAEVQAIVAVHSPAAMQEAAAKGREPEPEREQCDKEYVTLDKWREMSEADRAAVLGRIGKKCLNKQTNTDIEWADWSWNPVTGCRHPCPYCYARDIAHDIYPADVGFSPTIWPDRLTGPNNQKVPKDADNKIAQKNIFTCSMADLFGRWVPTEWIERVLAEVAANPQCPY